MSASLNGGRTPRRLPGLRFDAQPPPLPEKLPRMDVAVFVGFAASGPINRPVVVEDAAQFEAIFGADAALAWDRERGEQVRAHLAPTVRAFFRNGGRRCWVVRVAGSARSNLFPVAGLTRLRADGRLEPAYARARSKGSWSDSFQAGAVLTSRPLFVREFASLSDFQLEVTSPDEVVRGDLLRFTYEEGYAPVAVVSAVEQLARATTNVTSAAGGARRLRVRVRCDRVQWLRLPNKRPRVESGAARVLTAGGRRIGARAYATDDSEWNGDAPVTLDLALASADAPAPGSYVRVGFGKEKLWLRAEEVRVLVPTDTAQKTKVRVTGEATWVYKSKPGVALSEPVRCEKLLFDLHVRQGDAAPSSLSDLAFSATHERFWSALPSDEKLYEESWTVVENAHEEVWREASSPRFPLAGREEDDKKAVYFPVGMPTFFASYLSPLWAKGTSLKRDGLTSFTTGLFLDSDLRDAGMESLLTKADFIRYQSPRPRRLRGIHAALSVEEATIIAVPDAVHRGWYFDEPKPTLPEASKPLAHPEWWAYQECNPSPEIDPTEQPEAGHFLDCRLARLDPPALLLTQASADAGTLKLSWSSQIDARRSVVEEAERPDWRGATQIYDGPSNRHVIEGRDPSKRSYFRVREEVGPLSSDWRELAGVFDQSGAFVLTWTPQLKAAYVLEEATRTDWGDASEIYRGAANELTLYGRRAGDYFYRVRATVNQITSEWSAGESAHVGGASQWRVRAAKEFRANTLLEVHCSLLRMSAARGDLFALLSLPEHYREGDAVRHAAAIRPTARETPSTTTTRGPIAPLGFGETRALSFGALYHPWTIGSEGDAPTALRSVPPCGAAAGVMARRTLARGAWIAPANEPLRGVVSLTPPVLPAAWQGLQDAQVNLIRREPQGFLALSADTLSDDLDLRPINVRRLLILLRRLALRLGATYVFEPHSEAFRRQVKRGFEGMLGEMFQRGAFAGATPATSFQVNTGSELNTPQLTDAGRFIVEIKVAPSLPLTFLTLRLVQSSDRLATEER
ncbi:MAG TPA: hypothetical protein VFX96_00810 [Pyrinomonadaceae bacterium]|nr:hypothetical protein [Pyrinomonadaceae bacterium]